MLTILLVGVGVIVVVVEENVDVLVTREGPFRDRSDRGTHCRGRIDWSSLAITAGSGVSSIPTPF